jgi:glycerol-3-phosphate dehydrogenase
MHVSDRLPAGLAAEVEGLGTVRPEIVINATGAWAGACASMAGVAVSMRPTRGVMVAVQYPGLATVLNRCRPPADGDIAVPHGELAVLGTTSVAVDDPDAYPREQWEVQRTLEECAAMVPGLAQRTPVRTYWGVRPLYEPAESARQDGERGDESVDGDANTGEKRGISRGFALLDHAADGVDNFVSIVGGKLTTSRLMAEATTIRAGREEDLRRWR